MSGRVGVAPLEPWFRCCLSSLVVNEFITQNWSHPNLGTAPES